MNTSLTRHRLTRSRQNRLVAGVCGGVAEFFGISAVIVRVVFAVSLFVSFGWALLAYVVMGFIIPNSPISYYSDPMEKRFYRDMTFRPKDTYEDLRRRERDTSRRIHEIESYVTSKKFDLDREFRNLENSNSEEKSTKS